MRHESKECMSRRDFLQAGALTAGAVGASLLDSFPLPAGEPASARSCILLLLVGGPSQLDTWDPKPDAPDGVRSPFRPIHTNVPGIDLCQTFPRMASRADRLALVRSVHHDEAPIHETGLQLVQTGRLCRDGSAHPHLGAVVSHQYDRTSDGLPQFVILPGPLHSLGVGIGNGQAAGPLGSQHEPIFSGQEGVAFDLAQEPERVRSRYGPSTFGRSCLRARRLVERGVRLVTVNMFDTVFNRVTWDCHSDGDSLGTTLDDYRHTLCPLFDQVFTALLDDLAERELLATTLVVATGEFGRSPQRNLRGGRDHWPGCWTALFSGGGVRGGQVIGASDRHAAEPRHQPVKAAALAASVYRGLGIAPRQLVDAEPIKGLF
jgi:hypothetical protein